MTTKGYAAATTVSAEKTRAEIDTLLGKYGAKERGTATTEMSARVMFSMGGLTYRLEMPIVDGRPKKGEEPRGWWGWSSDQRDAWCAKQVDQDTRSRWRGLLLQLRAKLEAVRLGITTVEKEFMADLVTADGRTVHEALGARIAEALAHGNRTLALPEHV